MKTKLFFLLVIFSLVFCSCNSNRKIEDVTEIKFVSDSEIVLGDEQFDEYFPLLKNRRVAIFSNQTGIVGDKIDGEHIVDALINRGVNVTAIFSPEHGFRGTADAGAKVSDSFDEKTGVQILSLYDKETGSSPSKESMEKFDTLVMDMQDIGLRYYTYYISMYYLMDACARENKNVILLDRPNPNGFYVDGPVLQEKFKSHVGVLPIPTVYGMTWGELAKMINGEGWLTSGKNSLEITIIPCKNYKHDMKTALIKNPSPNIKDMKAVYLYASTCYFENTIVSEGRGTNQPFVCFGSPYFENQAEYSYEFVPVSMGGALSPVYEGTKCYGKNLQEKSFDEIWNEQINLEYIVDAYEAYKKTGSPEYFFGKERGDGIFWIDLLFGTDSVRKMIEEGKSAKEIKESWHEEIENFKQLRALYAIYE